MRIRITYTKSNEIRFTGHLDLHRVWERTFRRSRLPVSYSQGFNPQARIQIASALPLGFTSQCEMLDAWLDEDVPAQTVTRTLKNCSPPGITVIDTEVVAANLPALQTRVISNEYLVTPMDPIPEEVIHLRIDHFLSQKTVTRQRRNKTYDLRPLVESLECNTPGGDTTQIKMRLSARQGATGRPEEVVSALGFEPTQVHYHRTNMVLAK